MTCPDLSQAPWRKSSYSGGSGGNCVEVASLDKTAWRKSSRSGNNGGACVEVTGAQHGIAIRDSKDPGGPHLDVTGRDWQAFVNGLKTTRMPRSS